MNGKLFAGIVVVLLGVLVAFVLVQNRSDLTSEIPVPSLEESGMSGPPEGDSLKKEIDSEMAGIIDGIDFDYFASLTDITKGEEIRGVSTGGNADGKVGASFKEGQYFMKATFSNLPDPKNDDFYEGWLIRLSPFKFISTGKAEKINGVYTNMYSSEEDLTTLTRYVLTIEPNDGDSAPGPHLLEGDMVKSE